MFEGMLFGFSGQGNAGFYGGKYKKSNSSGVCLSRYVKPVHLKKAINRILKIGKEQIIENFKSSACRIFGLLSTSKGTENISEVGKNKRVFDEYIEGRAKFISNRFDTLNEIISKFYSFFKYFYSILN